ncbi:MAG: hypothetical protein H6622_11815 [Halobacteriovoraceae bacterium]|nr:hypothetical protein [Halobacteriovoraceae bacterium]
MKHLLFLTFFCSNLLFANELSLDDLKFDESKVKIDPVMSAKVTQRKSMLKTHQILALSSLAVLTGTILSGEEGKSTDFHKWSGIAGGALYYTAAGFALAAPELDGEREESWNMKWHKRLAWIHGPAMLLAPVLGYLANEKYKKGEKVEGILKAHSVIAGTAYFSLLAAATTMTFEF